MPPRQRRGAILPTQSPLRRRAASMGVATAMARREEMRKQQKEGRPLFAEEHYDAAEIEKRKKKEIAKEVKAARQGAEEAKAIAQEMAAEKEEAERQLRKREEDMESMARNVGKSAREAANRIRAYEAQNVFLQSEIHKNKDREAELKNQIVQLERKVDEAMDETQWVSDNAAVALREAEERQEEIRREVTKRIHEARKKENLLELTERHETFMSSLAAQMGQSIVKGIQLQLADLRDVLDGQQKDLAELQRFRTERLHERPPPAAVNAVPSYIVRPPSVVLGDRMSSPRCSSPSTPAASQPESYLTEGEADFLELPPEDNYYRTLKALPPRYVRVAAALESVVVGGLAVVAITSIYVKLVREGWCIAPQNLCVMLRLGGRDEVTTVRLVNRQQSTATYEADIAVPQHRLASIAPSGTPSPQRGQQSQRSPYRGSPGSTGGYTSSRVSNSPMPLYLRQR